VKARHISGGGGVSVAGVWAMCDFWSDGRSFGMGRGAFKKKKLRERPQASVKSGGRKEVPLVVIVHRRSHNSRKVRGAWVTVRGGDVGTRGKRAT